MKRVVHHKLYIYTKKKYLLEVVQIFHSIYKITKTKINKKKYLFLIMPVVFFGVFGLATKTASSFYMQVVVAGCQYFFHCVKQARI